MSIRICKLKAHIEAIPKLSILLYELICKKWSSQYSIEEIKAWFDDWKNENIPLAFIALDNDNPVGMCSLQFNDGIQSDLKPWLGDLCVDPAYQNKGTGKLLIEACKNQAKEQGFKKLYLFAPDLEIHYYYEHLGWRKIGKNIYKDNLVTVMEIEV